MADNTTIMNVVEDAKEQNNVKQESTSHTNDTGFGRSESEASSNSFSDTDSRKFSEENSDSSMYLSDDDISDSDDVIEIASDDDVSVFDDLRFSAINKSSRSYDFVSSRISGLEGGTIRSITSVRSATPHVRSYFQPSVTQPLPAESLRSSFKKKLSVDKTAINENGLKQQIEVLENGSGEQTSQSTSFLQSIGRFFRRKSSVTATEVVPPATPGEKVVFKDGDVATTWYFESRDTPDAVQEIIEQRKREFQRSKRASQRRQQPSEQNEIEQRSRLQSENYEFGFGSTGTDFTSEGRSQSMFALNTVGAVCNRERKLLHASPSPMTPSSDINYTPQRKMSIDSTTTFDRTSIFTNDDVISRHTISETESNIDPSLHVRFELRDSSKQQCGAWRSQFSDCRLVKIRCQYFFDAMNHDVIIVPGNSFGFLDGEPEIQYTNTFGWTLQTKIQEEIFNNHDGELLVGQAVMVRLEASDLVDIDEIMVSDGDEPRSHKYFIYVPVMRVPLHVQDSVNAYLAFRAAIRKIRDHNKSCDADDFISTVLCPSLCDGFGRMPHRRIAIQMKTAYDALVLGNEQDLIRPSNMGAMATAHVNMTSNKSGNWC